MVSKILRRTGLALLVAVLFLAVSVYATLYHVVNGPSPTVRDILVQSAEQASATKWLPELFLDSALIAEILNAGTATEAIQISDLLPVQTAPPSYAAASTPAPGEEPAETEPSPPDPWENAVDGMLFDTYLGRQFRAYVLIIKDPSTVYVETCKEFGEDKGGIRALDFAKKDNIIAFINGGGFYDPNGQGMGGMPLGLTYAGGQCVWDDGEKLTFIGITDEDRLIVRNSMTQAEADELGMRDGVCFWTNNTLISNENGNVTAYYADWDISLAQRTAIGQTADGAIIFMVCEGRTAAYLGANRNDIINAMLHYGAVSAGMLDGGSSSVMFCKDWADKFGIPQETLTDNQEIGLVYSANAFITSRRIPTYFAVKGAQ